MKKSMFKRGIASATGILLAASQLGVVAMNASAADVTVDTSYLTDVPVFVNPDGVLEYTDGSWYDLLAAAFTASDALDTEVSAEMARNAVKKLFAKYNVGGADAIAAAVSDATLTGSVGQYVLTAEVAECGPAVGAAIAEKLAGVKGAEVAMSVSGTVTVAIDLTTENTVAYEVTFTAEDGKTYTADTIEGYVVNKMTTALGSVGAADKIEYNLKRIANAKEKLNNLNIVETEFEAAYAALVEALPASLEDEAPATLADAIANERINAKFNEVVALFNDTQDIAAIDLTIADLAAIAAEAYDIQIAVQGAAGSAQFSIADDQNAELLAAFQEYYTTADKLVELQEYFVEDYELAEGYIYNVVDVQSHKELAVEGNMDASTYTVTRVIDSVTLEVVAIPEIVYTYELTVTDDITDNLYYWSEETVEFDLSGIDAVLSVYADGVLVENIPLPDDCFYADAASAAELEYTGYGVYTVGVNVSQEGFDAIVSLLETLEYNTANLEDAVFTNLNVAGFDVIVMDRGDASLDGTNDTLDAITTLELYNRVSVLKYTAEETQAAFGLNDQDFRALCYAADVDAAQDAITLDAINMLVYYNRNTVMGELTTWTQVIGAECAHVAEQHVDPLVIFDILN